MRVLKKTRVTHLGDFVGRTATAKKGKTDSKKETSWKRDSHEKILPQALPNTRKCLFFFTKGIVSANHVEREKSKTALVAYCFGHNGP